MAAPSGSHGPRVNNHDDLRSTINNTPAGADADLLQSLNKLSLSAPDSRSPSRASSTSPNPTARALSRLDRLTIDHSPSPQRRGSAPRSPAVRSASTSHSHSPSRSATPTLLRKNSVSSIHSANGIPPNRAPSRSSSLSLRSPAAARTPINGATRHIMIEEERPSKTEASVARDYFVKELEAHHVSGAASKSETLVILQDACYKHRYQRPFAGKANLGTIVERPERLQAVYTGVAMAYVRLGERHAEGKFQFTPESDPTALQIPFDIRKTDRKMSLHSPEVTNVHGAKWMEELAMICGLAKSKLEAGTLEIQRPDIDRGPGAKSPEPFHKGDLYLAPESLLAFEGALGATCEAVDAVFSDSPTKRAFVAVRPPGHHCDANFPHGFCWLNNVHVGIMHGFMNHGLTHAAIIDFDLHHGDGSQDIAWDHNYRRQQHTKGYMAPWKKSSIGYFSLHDIQSYPCEYGDPDAVKKASLCIEDAFSQNIWNVHLQQWKDHADFWYQYRTRISIVLEKARAYLRRETEKCRAAGQEPKAAIFFSAGFDASEFESQGMQRHKVNVPTEFYARISRDVVKMSFEEDLAVEGRIVSCLEGGYSDRALSSGVLAHLSGLAGNDVRAKDDITNHLSRSASRRVSLSASPLSRRSTLSSPDSDARSKTPGFPYESAWWTASELDRLDTARSAPFIQPRIPRSVTPPTYCSPTQSSNAKVSDFARLRRSMSGYPSPTNEAFTITRAPSPPPPAVYWPTATVEFSRLLIPSNGNVSSIQWEELKSEETRIKKEQKEEGARIKREQKEREGLSRSPSDNAAEALTVPVLRKSGRERKPVSYVEPEDPNKNRRRTVAGASILATEKAAARGFPTVEGATHSRQPSRRLSASSAFSTATTTTEPVAPILPTVPLPPSVVMNRPGTAQTIRPDSSLSVRTSSGVVPVKKARPSAIRKDSSKGAVPNTKSVKVTVPKASSISSKTKTKDSATAGKTSARSSKQSSPSQVRNNGVGPGLPGGDTSMKASTATSDSGTDLAGITNGMRKIKINVVTKEMKEAREKAAKEKRSASTTASKILPATPKVEANGIDAPHLSSGADFPTHSSPAVATSGVEFEHYQPQPATPNQENEIVAQQGIPPNADLPTSVPETPAPSVPQESHLFIPYQPEGATPQAVPQTAPTRWMAPNTVDTPAPFRGHNFTATSAIPFSPTKSLQNGPLTNSYPTIPFQKTSSAADFISLPAPVTEHERPANHGVNHETKTEAATAERTWNTAMEIPETPERSI